jgi:hypothetical protein
MSVRAGIPAPICTTTTHLADPRASAAPATSISQPCTSGGFGSGNAGLVREVWEFSSHVACSLTAETIPSMEELSTFLRSEFPEGSANFSFDWSLAPRQMLLYMGIFNPSSMMELFVRHFLVSIRPILTLRGPRPPIFEASLCHNCICFTLLL